VSARGATIVGDDVTVGHGAVFESCEIRRSCLIGMNAVILHGAIIEEESLVAALSVVPENMHVPARTLVAGAPARVRKELTGESAHWVKDSSHHYVELSRSYLSQGYGISMVTGGKDRQR
jgi:carbonic anhydrase/acetyltransferase-like protein (isoleucine patch superfamily)